VGAFGTPPPGLPLCAGFAPAGLIHHSNGLRANHWIILTVLNLYYLFHDKPKIFKVKILFDET
jgi:hypothetical protein